MMRIWSPCERCLNSTSNWPPGKRRSPEKLAKEAEEVLATGETFPFDFALTDLSGQNISLASYQGKVLIVDFWGTLVWLLRCGNSLLCQAAKRVRTARLYRSFGLTYEHGMTKRPNKELVTKFHAGSWHELLCAMGTADIRNKFRISKASPQRCSSTGPAKCAPRSFGAHEYPFLEAIVKILLAEAAPPPAGATDTPPAAPTDTPPAAPADTPPTDTPPAGEGTPPTDAPAEPGK